MSKPKTIRVEIDHARFWDLAQGHPVHHSVAVFKELRKAGIPIKAGIELRGVESGRLSMWNAMRNGKRFCVYEWSSVEPEGYEDDEL